MNRQERIRALKARNKTEPPKLIPGNPGTDGVDGRTPVKGVDYFDGKDGKSGRDGYAPIKGKDYFDGEPGKHGQVGEKGDSGTKGEKGVVWKDNWIPQARYSVDDIVRNFGSTYICIKEHKSSNTTRPGSGSDNLQYWSIFAEKGDTGAGGQQGSQGIPGPSQDATATTKGAVKLANDLGGTADLPTVVATHLSSPLPVNQGGTGSTMDTHVLKAGDTMSGVLAMGANKITGLANGTASTDAAAFGQIPTALPPSGTAGGDLSGSYPNPTVAKINGVAYSADPLTQYVALAPGSSARNVIQPTGASIIPAIIKGASSQSADLLQLQDSIGTILARLTANGDISFDGNRDYTISVGASGNPFPNTDRNLILRPQFYGSLKIQSGTDPTYGININPIGGGITFDKNPGFATVLDVPNGNGFNYIRIGTAEIYINVNSFVFRTRGASTENITLNLGIITSGQISLDVLTTGATGTATSGVTSYKSFSNSLIGSYWDGSAAQRIIGSQYIDAAAKQYRIAVLDTGVDPNQTTGSNVYAFDTSGNFVWANLSASSVTAGLVVENLSSGNPPLTLNKKANSSTGGMEWYSGGGSPALVASLDGAGKFSSLHLIGNGTAPSIAAGAGAGTSPTVSLTGHDTAGKISVTTGTLPTLSADVFTVTFNAGYASAPYVNFSPANAVTALLSGASMVYVTATTTTFKFTAGTTPLTAATTYLWNYSVIG